MGRRRCRVADVQPMVRQSRPITFRPKCIGEVCVMPDAVGVIEPTRHHVGHHVMGRRPAVVAAPDQPTAGGRTTARPRPLVTSGGLGQESGRDLPGRPAP